MSPLPVPDIIMCVLYNIQAIPFDYSLIMSPLPIPDSA